MFYVFPRAVKPDVCEQIVKECKQNILKDGLILNSNESQYDPDTRKTSIYFLTEKNNEINELIWSFLREANKIQFNYDLTFFQPIQFAEYKKGGIHDWHWDGLGGLKNEEKSNEIRKLSLTLALSDPDTYEGGELQFYNGDRPVEDFGNITGEQVSNDIKSQGSVVVFDSRDWHRVAPVTNGVRYSMVCWCVGPNFK